MCEQRNKGSVFFEKDRIKEEKVSLSRKEKKVDMAKKVFERYGRDSDFEF